MFHKQLKLRGRKVSWFIEFYHNVLCRKNFRGLLLIKTKIITFAYILALKMALIKLVGKTFSVHRKFMKPVKVFSQLLTLLFTAVGISMKIIFAHNNICMLQ